MTGTITSNNSWPSRVARMTAVVTNSDLRGYYNVWAAPGMFKGFFIDSKATDKDCGH
jgi:hypothetical protein